MEREFLDVGKCSVLGAQCEVRVLGAGCWVDAWHMRRAERALQRDRDFARLASVEFDQQHALPAAKVSCASATGIDSDVRSSAARQCAQPLRRSPGVRLTVRRSKSSCANGPSPEPAARTSPANRRRAAARAR